MYAQSQPDTKNPPLLSTQGNETGRGELFYHANETNTIQPAHAATMTEKSCTLTKHNLS